MLECAQSEFNHRAHIFQHRCQVWSGDPKYCKAYTASLLRSLHWTASRLAEKLQCQPAKLPQMILQKCRIQGMRAPGWWMGWWKRNSSHGLFSINSKIIDLFLMFSVCLQNKRTCLSSQPAFFNSFKWENNLFFWRSFWVAQDNIPIQRLHVLLELFTNSWVGAGAIQQWLGHLSYMWLIQVCFPDTS